MMNQTRTRRPHRKSRLGCFACKKRKAKCDELKPSCTRCTSTIQKCIYPQSKQPVVLPAASTPSSIDVLSSPSPPRQSDCLQSPVETSQFWKTSSRSLVDSSAHSSPTPTETKSSYSSSYDTTLPLSDSDLYHHYLQHTSRTFSQCQTDQTPLQIGIPSLALRSKPVYFSILALSAVCICCDMISRDAPPSMQTINWVLMTGYKHYNLASEQMRELMSKSESDSSTKEALLASTLLLVPFCSGSQQVNHWISTMSTKQEAEFHKALSITPRDIIIMMRGIKTTLQALDYHDSSPPPVLMPISLISSSPEFGFLPPSRRHFMFEVIAETSQRAFHKLQKRLESLYNDELYSACSAACYILHLIRSDTFSESHSLPIPSMEPTSFSQLHVGSWIRSYAKRHASWRPIEPLTMRFLGFLAEAPQEYLDLVLPLLDQRLENPIDPVARDSRVPLTKIQALALDIYAHWSVLMLLVEEESWWIGNLPTVTLTGMFNRYGMKFMAHLWPESNSSGEEEWWPGGMLNILRDIKRYR